jgi:hypothetical protein
MSIERAIALYLPSKPNPILLSLQTIAENSSKDNSASPTATLSNNNFLLPKQSLSYYFNSLCINNSTKLSNSTLPIVPKALYYTKISIKLEL